MTPENAMFQKEHPVAGRGTCQWNPLFRKSVHFLRPVGADFPPFQLRNDPAWYFATKLVSLYTPMTSHQAPSAEGPRGGCKHEPPSRKFCTTFHPSHSRNICLIAGLWNMPVEPAVPKGSVHFLRPPVGTPADFPPLCSKCAKFQLVETSWDTVASGTRERCHQTPCFSVHPHDITSGPLLRNDAAVRVGALEGLAPASFCLWPFFCPPLLHALLDSPGCFTSPLGSSGFLHAFPSFTLPCEVATVGPHESNRQGVGCQVTSSWRLSTSTKSLRESDRSDWLPATTRKPTSSSRARAMRLELQTDPGSRRTPPSFPDRRPLSHHFGRLHRTDPLAYCIHNERR